LSKTISAARRTPHSTRGGAPAGVPEPNLRRLRALLAVADQGAIVRASAILHRSQSVVTRAVLELEEEFGTPLFERSRQGMLPTDSGRILVHRARRALDELCAAEEELGAAGAPARFAQKLAHRQLQVLVAIAEGQSESQAARRMGLSQPAITRSLRELERLIAKPLFYRMVRGMIPTSAGEALIRRAKLAFAELDRVRDDMAAHRGRLTGRIAVGTLPLCATLLVPRAIDRLLREHPGLDVSILDGGYDSLLASLRCGDIDLLVGALRHPAPAQDVVQERLFDDRLSIVARRDHPLARRASLSLRELAQEQWVVPRRGTPARGRFEEVFASGRMPLPEHAIESGSWVAVRALLLESDRLTVISRQQIHFEEESGMLSVLPVALPDIARPIGIATRRNAAPSRGAELLVGQLRAVAAALAKERATNT
jgi:LysR family transcriptional regulator of gallate degradation